MNVFNGIETWTIFLIYIAIVLCTHGTNVNFDLNDYIRVGGHGQNTTSSHNFALYVGLKSFEYVDCQFEPGYKSYAKTCDRQSIKWTNEACTSGPIAPACQACSTVAGTMYAAAFFNCVGWILAFLGAQTRMRVAADIPVQKLAGTCAELWCVVTLTYALATFEKSCK